MYTLCQLYSSKRDFLDQDIENPEYLDKESVAVSQLSGVNIKVQRSEDTQCVPGSGWRENEDPDSRASGSSQPFFPERLLTVWRGTAFGPASQSRSWSLCPQPPSLPVHPLWLLEGKVPSLTAELPFLTAVLISSGAAFTSVVTQRHMSQTTVPLRRISPVLPSLLLRFGLLLPIEQGESLLG